MMAIKIFLLRKLNAQSESVQIQLIKPVYYTEYAYKVWDGRSSGPAILLYLQRTGNPTYGKYTDPPVSRKEQKISTVFKKKFSNPHPQILQ